MEVFSHCILFLASHKAKALVHSLPQSTKGISSGISDV